MNVMRVITSILRHPIRWLKTQINIIRLNRMHKKIMAKAAKDLEKDAYHYAKEEKHTKNPVKKKHEKIEKKEASNAAKDLKMRVKKAHEF